MADLTCRPKFKALSYTWDTRYNDIDLPEDQGLGYEEESWPASEILSTEGHWITCNECPVFFEHNLYDALMQVRTLEPDIDIWINAISSNRDDLDVRA
jgi:hypothetical protein